MIYSGKAAFIQIGFMGHRSGTKFIAFLIHALHLYLKDHSVIVGIEGKWAHPIVISKESGNILHWNEIAVPQGSQGHGLSFQYDRWVWRNDKADNILTTEIYYGESSIFIWWLTILMVLKF